MKQSLLIGLLIMLSTALHAQGIQRDSGIGFRASYWNMGGDPFSVVVDDVTPGRVNIEGVGAWLYYHSRIQDQLFMEFNTGAVSRLTILEEDSISTSVDVDVVFPLLAGVRYDLFSPGLSTRIQPYVSAGTGGYWRQKVVVQEQLGEEIESVTAGSQFDFGGYLGAGINIPFTSWVGFNLDARYHFVDFSTKTDISGPEFGLGFVFMWGKKREMFRVKQTRLIVEDIYPAYQRFYNSYPLALITIQNTAGHDIEINVAATLPPYAYRQRESGFVKLAKGETQDIPVKVFFDDANRKSSSREPAMLNIQIEGRSGRTTIKHISEQLFVHTRNSWDGTVSNLAFFLTPEDETVFNFARTLGRNLNTTLGAQPTNLQLAEAAFDSLSTMQISYQSDPQVPFYSDDRVQYAGETLGLRSGDCDDLVICYGSVLQSLGIDIAFVQVQDPDETLAHIYLLVDTGLAPQNASQISSNEKRYIVRENPNGSSSIWLPIETTLLREGFNNAWEAGATQYLQDGIIKQGVDNGWVSIFDVN